VDHEGDAQHRHMGYFSSDRTIQEYAEQIWHIDPVRL
jgi:starch phosphorylase